MKVTYKKGSICVRCGVTKVDVKQKWVSCVAGKYNHFWNKEPTEVNEETVIIKRDLTKQAP